MSPSQPRLDAPEETSGRLAEDATADGRGSGDLEGSPPSGGPAVGGQPAGGERRILRGECLPRTSSPTAGLRHLPQGAGMPPRRGEIRTGAAEVCLLAAGRCAAAAGATAAAAVR